MLRGLLDSKKLVPSLSVKINLGPAYIEEACRRAKLDLSKNADSLNENELGELFAGLIEVMEYVNKPDPTVYLKEGKYLDYSLFPLKKYEGMETLHFKSLSALLDDFYLHYSTEEKKVDERKLRVELKLKEQEKSLIEFREKARESKEIGDVIYQNFDKVEAILNFIKKMRKLKKNQEEIMRELKEIPEEAKLIDSIDLKKNKVVLEL
jgi:predicted ribosome quality control (RQC) complex YloA/Tae2 family protein